MQANTAELTQIVAKAKSGDETAFHHLVEQLSNTVFAVALAITKDLQHSKDVSQLVFIKAWQQLNKLKNDHSILPWIRQLTRYTAINYIRDFDGKKTLVGDEQIEAMLDRFCDETEQQDLALIKQQQNQLIHHLLEQLPDETREIVILYYREEHDSKAVADLLGLKEATVRKRLQRARDLLKEQVLEKYGKVIFSAVPASLATTLAMTALTTSPVAAASLMAHTVTTNQHWFIKLVLSLGGAALGGFIALITNNLMMKSMIKKIDIEEDIHRLEKLRRQGNGIIAATSVAFASSYLLTEGWLLPVVTYYCFVVGLLSVIRATNKINSESRKKSQQRPPLSAIQARREKFFCWLGLAVGVGGGSVGLFLGLINAGRFNQLF